MSRKQKILMAGSYFGIFFSGEDTGTGQTVRTAVQEISQNYETRLDAIKSDTRHNVLEMSGARAVWPEVLAVYAFKTTTDPDNGQEVASMDDPKKVLLKDIFWQMNVISSHSETATDTVVAESDDGDGHIIQTTTTTNRTTLYIHVSHQTADEMAKFSILTPTSASNLPSFWRRATAVYGARYFMALAPATARSPR